MGIKDYDPVEYSAMFRAGSTRAVISIAINNDNIFENNEAFTVNINSSLLPSFIAVSSPSEARVTIIDDDRKIIAV